MGNRPVPVLHSGFVASSSGNGMDPAKVEARTLRFGVFELDLRAGELRRSGMKVKLQEQPFQVLAQLLEKPGDVVTREEMRDRLWRSDTFVDFDHSLNAAIKRLRDALGDSAENPTFVETVARRGYRFLAPVTLTPSNGNGTAVVSIRSESEARLASWHRVWWLVGGIAAVVLVLLGIWLGAEFVRQKPAELRTTRLTATPADDWVRVSMISRDGKYLAYADQTGLYVEQIDTSETRPINLPPGFIVQSGSWMPDSVHLIVSLDHGSIKEGVPAGSPNEPASRWGIWEISVLGGDPRPLSDFGRSPTSSPDGKKIAFIRGTGRNEEIWLMSADGSGSHKLVGGPGDWYGVLAWSPDGTGIAYTKGRLAMGGWGTKGSLEIVHVDNLRTETLSSSTALCPSLVWSSDRRLIFTQTEVPPNQNDSNLWSLQLDRNEKPVGEPNRLTHDSGWVSSISLSTDKKRLAVLREFHQPEVYVARVEAGNNIAEPQRLTLDDRGDLPFAWTSDSKQVIFVSQRAGPYSIFRQDMHETVPELVAKGEPAAGIPRLTPDGRSVVYLAHPTVGQTPGNVSLMRVSLWGGSPTKILESPNLSNHQCARMPSTTCIYSDLAEDGTTFWYFDPAKGKGDRLLKIDPVNEYANWSLSGDGTMLAVVERKKTDATPELRYFTLSTGEEQRFSMTPCSGIPTLDWAADGKTIWSVCRSSADGKDVLMNIDRQGRMRQVWKPEWLEMSWVIPSPDGRYLAMSKATGTANVWMLEKF
jgi:DNA-binding winged helix-turn-helix (wHTH) protein/Tol biopolymer transport system component